MFAKLDILYLLLVEAYSLYVDFVAKQINKELKVYFFIHKWPHRYGDYIVFILGLQNG